MTKKIYVSNVPRAQETGEIVKNTFKSLGDDISLRIRDEFSYNNPKYYSTEILDEWTKTRDTSGKSENEFVTDFLDGKWETKPILLARPYLKRLAQVFDRVVETNKLFSIIAFRHGDKSPDGGLSDLGKEQANLLGLQLSQNENNKDIIFIATHNTINESIIRCLVSDDNLPDEWRHPLGFAETVKYTFYPKTESKESNLEIEWRGIKKEISFDDFKKFVSGL